MAQSFSDPLVEEQQTNTVQIKIFLRHQWYDVVPWLACCHFTKDTKDDCDKYYKYRPSDDCSDYDPPLPARASGDPHITTLDSKMFTFNGAGEFLMLSSTLHNVTFQARMEVFRDTRASVYTAFAIQTNDSGESTGTEVKYK